MSRLMRIAAVTLSGLVASILTALLLFGIRAGLHFDFYNLFFKYIIPVGALVSGFVAGLGYAAGAHLVGYRPGKGLFLAILLGAVATHLTLLFLEYITIRAYGTPLWHIISFPRYVHIVSTSWSFSLDPYREYSRAAAMGAGGYAIVGLQIAGFTGTAILACSGLRYAPYCDKCAGYLNTYAEVNRYQPDADLGQDKGDSIAALMEEGKLQAAVQEFEYFGSLQQEPSAAIRAAMTLRACRKCGKHWLLFRMSEKAENDVWMAMDDYRVEAVSETPIDAASLKVKKR